MKSKLWVLTTIVVLLAAPGVALADRFVEVHAVEIEESHIRISGVLDGGGAEETRDYFNFETHPEPIDRCQRAALLVLMKPGKLALDITLASNSFFLRCKVSRIQ